MSAGAALLLDVARRELGTTEVPPGSNVTKYGAWYGFQGAWCAMFVSWCSEQAGSTDVIPRYAYCPAGADWFQQRGRFDRRPAAGALEFLDVSGMGRLSHTGIVESVNTDGSWYAIEGNTDAGGSRTGGQVRRVRRTTVGTSRGGFGHPLWAAQPAPAGSGWAGVLLRRGSSGPAVRAVQDALNGRLTAAGRPALVVDGQFGPATETAARWFQRTAGLTDDGIIGARSWGALFGPAGR